MWQLSDDYYIGVEWSILQGWIPYSSGKFVAKLWEVWGKNITHKDDAHSGLSTPSLPHPSGSPQPENKSSRRLPKESWQLGKTDESVRSLHRVHLYPLIHFLPLSCCHGSGNHNRIQTLRDAPSSAEAEYSAQDGAPWCTRKCLWWFNWGLVWSFIGQWHLL